jgi:DNA-binding NarL/FixJ family response regulator
MLRLGLSGLLRSFRSFRVCAETEDVRKARELFARHRPDLVILGLTLRHGDGVNLIKDLKKSAPQVRIMVLSQRTDILSLQRSFRAGADGYLAAHEALSEFPRALVEVTAGEIYASPLVARLVLQVMAGGEMKPTASENKLSDRELQIFALIGRGLGATRVARELHLSVKTVETHRTRIKQKLSLRSGAELNRCAENWVLGQIRNRAWKR